MNTQDSDNVFIKKDEPNKISVGTGTININ